MKEALFLCQLIYWTPRGHQEKGDGWLYKSVEEMGEETGLSYKEQLRARRSLVRVKLIEEKYERLEHRLYFRINVETLHNFSPKAYAQREDGHLPNGHMPPAQREDVTCPKVKSYKETEITTETTALKAGGDSIPTDTGSLARGLLENLGYPVGTLNLRAAMDSIQAEIKSGKSSSAAYEYILAKARDAKERGEIPSIRFWLADAKYNQLPAGKKGLSFDELYPDEKVDTSLPAKS